MTSEDRDTITSPTNPLIKRLRSLERKKGRTDSGLFIAEGSRIVSQGLRRGWHAETLLVANTVIDRPHIKDLIAEAEDASARVIEVPEKLIGKVARKDNPQSVVAAFHQRQLSLDELRLPSSGLWLALYEIRDPGNLGTILRTADCAKVDGVVLVGTCCDPYSVEAVRASMGSVFDIPFVQSDFESFDTWRTGAGINMVAASVNGTARHDSDIYGKRAVVLMGNEQSGVPEDIEARCDTLALIPMRGGADSLNLAQATAIMTYEIWRQRGFA